VIVGDQDLFAPPANSAVMMTERINYQVHDSLLYRSVIWHDLACAAIAQKTNHELKDLNRYPYIYLAEGNQKRPEL
jgi:hypothetical protein